jgi:hypothetical protein
MRSLAVAVIGAILVALALAPSVRAQDESPVTKLLWPLENGGSLEVGGVLRGFYRNDQRIAWSGVEETFGSESALRSLLTIPEGDWTLRARSEFFLNEPSGATLLSDPVRDRYRADFNTPVFEVFQLAIEFERNDWLVRVGKIRSFLGSDVAPILTNNFIDAPFLQTEIIGFSETGIFVRWHPGPWSFELGLTNGESNLDTNSSKALIARVGIDRPNWSFGIWDKIQDGIGSEELKRFNSFVGFDARIRAGDVVFYGEGLVDAHGLYRDPSQVANPLAITDVSLYGLDVFRGFDKPTYGGGFDVGALYRFDRLMVDVNYGIYFPQHTGIPSQDAPVRRGLTKWTYDVTRRLQIYSVLIFENGRPQQNMILNNYSPRALLFGLQFGF